MNIANKYPKYKDVVFRLDQKDKILIMDFWEVDSSVSIFIENEEIEYIERVYKLDTPIKQLIIRHANIYSVNIRYTNKFSILIIEYSKIWILHINSTFTRLRDSKINLFNILNSATEYTASISILRTHISTLIGEAPNRYMIDFYSGHLGVVRLGKTVVIYRHSRDECTICHLHTYAINKHNIDVIGSSFNMPNTKMCVHLGNQIQKATKLDHSVIDYIVGIII